MEGSSKAGEPVSSKVAPMPLVGGGIEEEEVRMLDGEIEKLRSDVSKKRTKQACCAILGLMIFCFVGGWLFHTIEAPAERKRRDRFNAKREVLSTFLDDVERATSDKALNASEAFERIKQLRKDFDTINEISTLRDFVNGKRRSEPSEGHWGLAGSIFYCLTVITTIGYGAFTASTVGGKVLTVFMALFGVSYFGIVLSFVGERMLVMLEYTFHKLQRKSEKELRDIHMERMSKQNDVDYKLLSFILFVSVLHVLIFAALATHFKESWGFGNGVYFAIVSFTTVGLGDYYPHPSPDAGMGERIVGYFIFSFMLLIGLSLISAIIAACADIVEILNRVALKKVRSFRKNFSRRLTAIKKRGKAPTQEEPDTKGVVQTEEMHKKKADCARAVRIACGAGSKEYLKLMSLFDCIDDVLKKGHAPMHKMIEIETHAKDIVLACHSIKHDIVDIVLFLLHNVTVQTNEEGDQDEEWVERVKKILTHGRVFGGGRSQKAHFR